MDIYFDEKILDNIFNNDALTAELCKCIGAVVDAELEKSDDEIDFSFVDECSDLLLEIQGGDVDYNRLLPILNSESFIENTKRLAKGGIIKFARIGLAAAIILTSALSVNAAVGNITGRTIIEHIIENDDTATVQKVDETKPTNLVTHRKIEKTTDITDEEPSTEKTVTVYEPEAEKASVIYEEEVTETTTFKHESIDSGKEAETTTHAPIVTGLDAVVVRSIFKTEYLVGDEFSAEGLYLIANYSDGTSKTIDISQCTISGFDSSSPAVCRVHISYRESVYIIEITVKESETTAQQDENEEVI